MLVFALAMQAATATQTRPTPPSPQTEAQEHTPEQTAIAPAEAMAHPEKQSDDIVVTGLRDLDDPQSAVTRRTLGSSRTGMGPQVSRETFSLSQRFARCALSTLPTGQVMTALRDTIDGNVNSSRQRGSQGRFVQLRSTCAQDSQLAQQYGFATITTNYDSSYYDRGALLIEIFQHYVPDLKLTAAETADPEIQRRFDLREVPRAKFRLPVDRFYSEVAICMVRLQPELSVRLVMTQGSADTVDRLEAAIVNRAKACVGNARHVYFDASQFRFYIADSVYRWAVAARGVDSLLPPTPAK